MIIEVHGTVRGFTNVRARVGKTCVLLRVFFSCVTFVFLRVPRVLHLLSVLLLVLPLRPSCRHGLLLLLLDLLGVLLVVLVVGAVVRLSGLRGLAVDAAAGTALTAGAHGRRGRALWVTWLEHV